MNPKSEKTIMFVGLLTLITILTLTQCQSEDHDHVTNTQQRGDIDKQNIAGQWQFVGQLVSNSCSFEQRAETAQMRLNVSLGQVWTAAVLDNGILDSNTALLGAASSSTLSLWNAADQIQVKGGCPQRARQTLDIIPRDTNAGEGNVTLTWSPVSGCNAEASCAVVYVGDWLRLSAVSTPVVLPTRTLRPATTPTPTSGSSRARSTPTPTPTPTSKITPTRTPVAPVVTATPTRTPSGTPTMTLTPTIQETPGETPRPTETPTATPSLSLTPTATPIETGTPTATPRPTKTPTATPRPTKTPTRIS
jgi:hypothetical protein